MMVSLPDERSGSSERGDFCEQRQVIIYIIKAEYEQRTRKASNSLMF
jgi:hypothetical protein